MGDSDAQMVEGSASGSEDDDQDDAIVVDEALSTLGRKLDHENDILDISAEESLRQVIAHEKELLQVGEIVGQKGRPRQVVSDAALNERLGIISTTTIRSIRIRKSTWNSKIFSKFLINQVSPDTLEEDSDTEEPGQKDQNSGDIYVSLVDLLRSVQPGLAPDLSTIYGSYATSKEGKSPLSKAQTQKREAVKKEKGGPKKVRKVEQAEKVVLDGASVSTDHTMDRIIQLSQTLMEVFLETQKPVSLLRLCVDPESFTKTVENFFCFSFLIRDEKASLFLDDDQIPVCCPVGAAGEEDDGLEQLVRTCSQTNAGEDSFRQLMVSLTEDSWKSLVQTMTV
ncbi:hypothetical protein RvY_17751 [Ramazzottius varieornatus]|uniref:Non-structural maintenance of chromosomes element 4 n=1 Tax=Ramazzottius varieornatus TaxID=947166 RepID=A0A1D1W8Z1_RAMVA|nr:hypothetical protein RvY_17751 [Ramazzottius varieornatus]